MDTVKQLEVYRGSKIVGVLLDEPIIKFVYDASWLKNHGKAISPSINTTQAEHSGISVESYFENLLPEANIRELLKLKYQVTTTFGLLSVIGEDTASDITILKKGQKPTPPDYQEITWEDIVKGFNKEYGIIQTTQEKNGLKISLAGAQRKQSVVIHNQDKLFLPIGSAPSTHIVKPNIIGLDNVWGSAINETLMMKLAYALGIDVAETYYQPIAKSCVIKRYDRIFDETNQITRLHQLDLCQLDGKPSTIKYESDGGPTLLRCHQLLKENGVPAKDTKRLIQWIFFNLYVGNNDSHAKNLSIYFPPEEGARLTPFYDLLSTSIYSGLSNNFAFRIGGENKLSKIGRNQLIAMSEELGFKPNYVLNLGEALSNKLLATLEKITNDLDQMAAVGTEKTMLQRLSQHVKTNTERLQMRFFKKTNLK
jgi:serine/threonine-protein kinase HipA